MQETIDEASEGLELPKQDYTDHCFIFLFFVMYVFYKKVTIINEKFLVFDLDESRIEFILVFIVHLLCHVWML